MKKSFLLVFTVASFLCLSFFTTAYAYPVSKGQDIYFLDGPGSTNGGEFRVFAWGTTNPELFRSFCLETNEHITLGAQYKFTVGDISTEAKGGGSGGPNPDPISEQTAYLYHHFYHNSLAGYVHDDTHANLLQKAIWYFEGENGGETNEYTILANNNVGPEIGKWQGLGDVRVINLLNASGGCAQDQLTVTAVPEPATMLLLGCGLISLAGIGRRKFRK